MDTPEYEKQIKKIRKAQKDADAKKEKQKKELALYLSPNFPLSYMGNDYSEFVYTSVRGIGKTVIGLETAIILKNKYGWDNVKCYYFRTTDKSIQSLLTPEKAVDPYLVSKYNMEITKNRNEVFDHGRKLYEAYALTSAANVGKGINLYDCNWFGQKDENGKLIKRFIVTIWDEFMQDEGVGKRSIGDPCKQYMIFREAIFRDQERTMNLYGYNGAINFLLANNVSECANVTGQLFGYINKPNYYQPVKLKRKHALFWNVPITEAKKTKIKKSFNAGIIDTENDKNYAQVEKDLSMVKPKRVQIHKVTKLIKFSEDKREWFCVYDNEYIKSYRGECVKDNLIVAMYRNIGKTRFNPEASNQILQLNDIDYYSFADIMSMARWKARMKEYRPK